MCSICWQTPCHPRCPNAPEPKPAAYCRKCNEPLFVGDKQYDGIIHTARGRKTATLKCGGMMCYGTDTLQTNH